MAEAAFLQRTQAAALGSRVRLPLKIALMRLAEFALQTISGGLECSYFGTEPFDASGNSVERSGWATALLAQSANVPSSTTSVHTLLSRTATYTMGPTLAG